MNRFLSAATIVMLAVLSILVPVHRVFGQASPKVILGLPSGDWSMTHSLGSQLGLGDAGVQILENSGDASNGLEVTVNRIVNTTNKTVSAVRFGWFIYRTDTAKISVLARGHSSLVGVADFTPGQAATVDYRVVRFADAIEPNVKNGALAGTYNVEVVVTQIVFADGTAWSAKFPKQ